MDFLVFLDFLDFRVTQMGVSLVSLELLEQRDGADRQVRKKTPVLPHRPDFCLVLLNFRNIRLWNSKMKCVGFFNNITGICFLHILYKNST